MSDLLSTSDYVIILDDDPMIQRIIESATNKKSVCFSTNKQLAEFQEQKPPLVVFVDIHLGLQDNGLDVLPKLKDKWPFCPIIVITGDRNEDAVGNALASGADDFVYKPINTKELVARMQARLEELAKREAKEVVKLGDVIVDLSHRSIVKGENVRYMSPTEMNLLSCLINAHGTVVRREAMKRRCWGQIYVSDNALNRKLHEVRRALKEVGSRLTIRTLYGTGFIIEYKDDREKKVV